VETPLAFICTCTHGESRLSFRLTIFIICVGLCAFCVTLRALNFKFRFVYGTLQTADLLYGEIYKSLATKQNINTVVNRISIFIKYLERYT